MLALDFIRDNLGAVEKAIKDKGVSLDLDALILAAAQVRGLRTQIDQLRTERNSISASFKNAAPEERAALGARAREAGAKVSELEKELAEHEHAESIDEMKHAESLIERILFLDSTPKMEYLELNVGGNVQQQIEADLSLEVNAVAMYNKAIQAAREAGDDQSRELFSKLLKDEEEHVDWLEAQVHQIKEMGYERYLTLHVEGPKD